MKSQLALFLLTCLATLIANARSFPQPEDTKIYFPDDDIGEDVDNSEVEGEGDEIQTNKLVDPTGTRTLIINKNEDKKDNVSEEDEDDVIERTPNDVITDCASLDGAAMPFKVANQSWECFNLTTQGPCDEGEWFIIDENSEFPEAICKVRDCLDDNEVLLKDECQKVKSLSRCPRGMELRVNPFGNGECDCREGFLWVEDDKGIPKCYQEFLQGPCADGEQLVSVQADANDVEINRVECRSIDCPPGQLLWENGECLKSLMCGEAEEIVVFNEELHVLECDIQLRQVLSTLPVASCKEGQSADAAGECKDVEQARERRSNLAMQNKKLLAILRLKYPGRF